MLPARRAIYAAEAKSGAGAGNVGVAGSLAANIVVNTTVAALEGDSASDGDKKGAVVNAGNGDILIEAANATTSTVKSGADVTGTGGTAKVGVGASIGVNVGVKPRRLPRPATIPKSPMARISASTPRPTIR